MDREAPEPWFGKDSDLRQHALKRIIHIAEDNNWHCPYGQLMSTEFRDGMLWLVFFNHQQHLRVNYEAVIFDHAFARALWRHNVPVGSVSDMRTVSSAAQGRPRHWSHHLQEMVISEDPVKYLKENV